MSGPSKDLDQLKSMWRQEPAGNAWSLQQLRRAARLQTRWLYASIIIESLGAAAATALFVWLASGAETSTGQFAYLAIGVLALAVTSRMLWLRQTVLRARAAAPCEYLELQARRSRVAMQLAWMALIGGPTGVAIGLVMGCWLPSAVTVTALEVTSSGAVALFVIGFAAMLTHAAWVVRRERRRLAATERALRELR
jgi:hypothetical protein